MFRVIPEVSVVEPIEPLLVSDIVNVVVDPTGIGTPASGKLPEASLLDEYRTPVTPDGVVTPLPTIGIPFIMIVLIVASAEPVFFAVIVTVHVLSLLIAYALVTSSFSNLVNVATKPLIHKPIATAKAIPTATNITVVITGDIPLLSFSSFLNFFSLS